MEKQFVTRIRQSATSWKRDFAFVFAVLVGLFKIGVDRVNERGLDRLVRRAAVLEPRGVVVILNGGSIRLEKTERRRHAHLVFGLILAVLALSLGLDDNRAA